MNQAIVIVLVIARVIGMVIVMVVTTWNGFIILLLIVLTSVRPEREAKSCVMGPVIRSF